MRSIQPLEERAVHRLQDPEPDIPRAGNGKINATASMLTESNRGGHVPVNPSQGIPDCTGRALGPGEYGLAMLEDLLGLDPGASKDAHVPARVPAELGPCLDGPPGEGGVWGRGMKPA